MVDAVRIASRRLLHGVRGQSALFLEKELHFNTAFPAQAHPAGCMDLQLKGMTASQKKNFRLEKGGSSSHICCETQWNPRKSCYIQIFFFIWVYKT